jgi:hypothetical protein
MIRTLPVLCALLAIPAVAMNAQAAEETVPVRHHVTGALGAGFTFCEPGYDGHWSRSGFGAGARLGYSYRIASFLELGADATYFRVAHDDGPDMLLPAASVRAHLELGHGVELGFTARVGMTFLRLYDVAEPQSNWKVSSDLVWTGGSYALAPDLRIPIAQQTALLVSLELAAGGGSTEPTRVENTYLHEQTGFGQAALWIGVVQGL